MLAEAAIEGPTFAFFLPVCLCVFGPPGEVRDLPGEFWILDRFLFRELVPLRISGVTITDFIVAGLPLLLL